MDFQLHLADLFRGDALLASVNATSATSAEDLVRHSDTAMYQAKDAGRNGVSVFDTQMRDRVTERLTIERDLHLALERDDDLVEFRSALDLRPGEAERRHGAAPGIMQRRVAAARP